jgi:hypothetical protein
MRRLPLGVLALASAGCQLVLGIDPDVQILGDGGGDAHLADATGGDTGGQGDGDARVSGDGGSDAKGPGDGAGGADATDDGVYWIYRNGTSYWVDDSYSAKVADKDTTGDPPTGSYDIQVTLTSKYGAWAVHISTGDLDTQRYHFLTFALRPTVADQIWTCTSTQADNSATSVNVSDYATDATVPPAEVWGYYAIPLSKLDAVKIIYKIDIQDQTQRATNHWYIDNVALVP